MLNGFTQNIDSSQIAAFSKSFLGLFIYLIVYLIWAFVGMKLFHKAGKNGMSAFIPFFNVYELCEIIYGKGKGWFCVFTAIPPASYVMYFALHIGLAKAFGKKDSFGIFAALLPVLIFVLTIASFVIFFPFAFLGIFLLLITVFLPVFPAYYAFDPNCKYVGPFKKEDNSFSQNIK